MVERVSSNHVPHFGRSVIGVRGRYAHLRQILPYLVGTKFRDGLALILSKRHGYLMLMKGTVPPGGMVVGRTPFHFSTRSFSINVGVMDSAILRL